MKHALQLVPATFGKLSREVEITSRPLVYFAIRRRAACREPDSKWPAPAVTLVSGRAPEHAMCTQRGLELPRLRLLR